MIELHFEEKYDRLIRVDFNYKSYLDPEKIKKLIEKAFPKGGVSWGTLSIDSDSGDQFGILMVMNPAIPLEFLLSTTFEDLWIEKITDFPNS